jgi:hypothetical protein
MSQFRYQGETIRESGNIHDVKFMNFNELYTALSRFKELSQIHLDFSDKYFARKVESETPKKLKYLESHEGFIYRLTNDQKMKEYIGCTERTIQQGFEEHLEDSKFIKEHEGHWKWEEINKIYFVTPKELRRVETKFIEIYYFKNNGYEVVNKQKLPQ